MTEQGRRAAVALLGRSSPPVHDPKECPLTDLHANLRGSVDALPSPRQRLVALSGIAFAVFLLVAWFSNGAETPHYTAPNHEWTTSAHDTKMKIAYAGGLIGMTSFIIATVTFSSASAEGAQAHADVSRAVATGDVGPFLVAPIGFAALLGAGGLARCAPGRSHAGPGSSPSSAPCRSRSRFLPPSTAPPTAAYSGMDSSRASWRW